MQAQGVNVQKKSTSILQIVTLTSPDARYDGLYLANYATISLKDELARLPGVGNVNVFGAGQYAMRVWLDPEKMKARGLTCRTSSTRCQQQNSQVTAGQIGQPPAPKDVAFQYTLNVAGRLDDPEQFANVIVKTGANGEITRVSDVGRVELGAQTYGQVFTAQRQAGGGPRHLPARRAPTRSTSPAKSRRRWRSLSRAFPQGLAYDIPFDTTIFVKASIDEVYKTLFEAAILVLIVILVFLQDWRAMLVPATTVPVTIIGAFAAMAALGFTVNFATLFAIVLAIGIVVDDAIVVVEGAAHNIDHGMSGPQAAIEAMRELLGPIIGITLVLMAVFLPAAFLPGLTGQMYAQFALVIAATALIQRHQRRDAEADAMRAVAAALGADGEAQRVLPRLQRRLLTAASAATPRLMRRLVGVAGIMVVIALVVTGLHALRVLARADRLHPDRGPGLHAGDRAVAGRRLAAAHAGGARQGRRTRQQDAGRRQGHHHRRRVAARQQRLARQCRRRLHHPQGLGRARQGAGPVADAQQPQRGDGADRGRDRARAAAAADPGHRLRRRLHHAARAARQQPRLQQARQPSPAASSPMRRRSRPSPWCCRRSAPTRRNTRSTSTG